MKHTLLIFTVFRSIHQPEKANNNFVGYDNTASAGEGATSIVGTEAELSHHVPEATNKTPPLYLSFNSTTFPDSKEIAPARD